MLTVTFCNKNDSINLKAALYYRDIMMFVLTRQDIFVKENKYFFVLASYIYTHRLFLRENLF